MAAKKYVQALTQYLAGSGVVIGATSIVLTSLTDIYGNDITSISSFGDKGYITLEPDTTNEEAATFTGVTANSNGTVTLTGVSTVIAQSPYTETSGLVRGHAGGTKVVITDNVAFWNTFTNKNNDETIDGQWTFNNTPIVPGTVSDASTTVKGVGKLSTAPVSPTNPIFVGDNDTRVPTQAQADALAGTGTPSSSNKFVTNDTLRSVIGGTGADGALSITSGTTTIDCASAAVVVKNYTSISITGTGALAFSNPNDNGTIIILKSQGDVTITSSATRAIDLRSLGGKGGAGVTGISQAGNNGSYGTGLGLAPYTNGGTTTQSGEGVPGAGWNVNFNTSFPIQGKAIAIYAGAGGASGSTGAVDGSSGNGGRGAGGLYIECNGALNYTGAIDASGAAATNGTGSNAGGGGGGAGGSVLILCHTLTANTGSVTITGGAAGTGTNGGKAGGAGGSHLSGVAGSSPTGGVGAAGYYYIGVNTDIV